MPDSTQVPPDAIDAAAYSPPVRLRRKGTRIDMDRAFGLYCRFRNYHEVARILGCTTQGVAQGLKHYKTFIDQLPNVEQYRHDRIDIFTAAEAVAIRSCVDDRAIEKAPLAARSTNFGIIQQRRREEEGKGGSINVFHGVMVNIQREALGQTMRVISGPEVQPDGDAVVPTHKAHTKRGRRGAKP